MKFFFFLQFEECTIWKNELFAKIWLDLTDSGMHAINENPYGNSYSQLKTYYPHYPNELTVLHCIQEHNDDFSWRLLAKFIAEKQKLEV